MQRTIRVLRIALPVVFISFIIVLGISWRTKGRREKPVATPVTSTQRPADTAHAEAKSFEDTQTIGGRVAWHIRAARVVAFQSGWNTLEGVEMTIFRPNGLTYKLTCPEAQYNGTNRQAEAKGGVRVSSNDGVDISTAEIRYDGARLTNDIPVQFKVDRWQGNAGAIDLDVAGETMRLVKGAKAVMVPATPAEPPMTVTGNEAMFRRIENDVTFSRNARVVRGADVVTADQIVGRFTQDRKTLVALEGGANVVIVMAASPATGENLGGRKEIRSDRFFTEVGGDGQISAFNAVGESLPVRAKLEGPPARDITSRTLRVALVNKAVSEIKGEGDVVMNETGELPRTINAGKVTVSFDPVQHRAVAAFLEGNFRYKDPRTNATAMRANYDIVNDRVVLTADYGFDPTVVSDGHTLKAKQIEFAPKAQTARATGEVIAQLQSKGGGPSADATSVFPTGRPVFVNADALLMTQANKTAVFTGNVRAFQENNTVLSNEMQVQGDGNSITARGNVRATLYNATGEARKTPVTSRSDQLIARRDDRRIDLAGSVKIDDEARTLTSEKATFFLDANRKIDRVEAETKVVLVERPTGRRGTGDRVTYSIPKKLALMTGSPATAKDANGEFKGEQIAFDLAHNRVQVLSRDSQPQGTYKQPQ